MAALSAHHATPSSLSADARAPTRHYSRFLLFARLNQSSEVAVAVPAQGLSWNGSPERAVVHPRLVRIGKNGRKVDEMTVARISAARDCKCRNRTKKRIACQGDASRRACSMLRRIKLQDLTFPYIFSLAGAEQRRKKFSTLGRKKLKLGVRFLAVGQGVRVGSNFRRSKLSKALISRNARDVRYEQGRGKVCKTIQLQRALYDDFVQFSVEKVGQFAELSPVIGKNNYDCMVALDGKTIIRSLAYTSEKIRLFRIATIDGGDAMQVLNLAVFAQPKYDVPIFCADFFSSSKTNICVLDLNPLYSTEQNKDYKEKYFKSLLPMAKSYIELFPWGGKLTAESLQFFSPIVLWTKPNRSPDVQQTLYSAFQDYLLAWLSLLEFAVASPNQAALAQNQEAQHRYIMWRATKDPGRPVLKKLLGEEVCEKYINEFLFSGLQSLGTKSFLDYFPDYKVEDGSVSTARSVAGRSYSKRPWGEDGNFIQRVEV